jgi:hypothetical protein
MLIPGGQMTIFEELGGASSSGKKGSTEVLGVGQTQLIGQQTPSL